MKSLKDFQAIKKQLDKEDMCKVNGGDCNTWYSTTCYPVGGGAADCDEARYCENKLVEYREIPCN